MICINANHFDDSIRIVEQWFHNVSNFCRGQSSNNLFCKDELHSASYFYMGKLFSFKLFEELRQIGDKFR